jgi:hypothetical protein
VKNKSKGELLFDSYDRDKSMCEIKQKYKVISAEFPRKNWHQLSNGDRENWERIAAEDWHRIDRECSKDRISGIVGISLTGSTKFG